MYSTTVSSVATSRSSVNHCLYYIFLCTGPIGSHIVSGRISSCSHPDRHIKLGTHNESIIELR